MILLTAPPVDCIMNCYIIFFKHAEDFCVSFFLFLATQASHGFSYSINVILNIKL